MREARGAAEWSSIKKTRNGSERGTTLLCVPESHVCHLFPLRFFFFFFMGPFSLRPEGHPGSCNCRVFIGITSISLSSLICNCTLKFCSAVQRLCDILEKWQILRFLKEICLPFSFTHLLLQWDVTQFLWDRPWADCGVDGFQRGLKHEYYSSLPGRTNGGCRYCGSRICSQK